MLRSAARKLMSRLRWTDATGMEVPAYRVVRCGVGVIDQRRALKTIAQLHTEALTMAA
jgi:hypothetical protein